MMVQIPMVIVLGLIDWGQDVSFIIDSWNEALQTEWDKEKSDFFVSHFTAVMLVTPDYKFLSTLDAHITRVESSQDIPNVL